MITLFVSLIVVVSILLVLVVMVQNPKGGGLSSSFGGGGSQMVSGVRKTGDFLDKSTWTLAGLLVVLILLSNSFIKGFDSNQIEDIEEIPAVISPVEKTDDNQTTEDDQKSPSEDASDSDESK